MVTVCGTPYCGAVFDGWCYRCRIRVSSCACMTCNSGCLCGNEKNWLAIGEHKSRLIARAKKLIAKGGNRWVSLERAKQNLQEWLRIGSYPPTENSYEYWMRENGVIEKGDERGVG